MFQVAVKSEWAVQDAAYPMLYVEQLACQLFPLYGLTVFLGERPFVWNAAKAKVTRSRNILFPERVIFFKTLFYFQVIFVQLAKHAGTIDPQLLRNLYRRISVVNECTK